jgi:hypothetical protein
MHNIQYNKHRLSLKKIKGKNCMKAKGGLSRLSPLRSGGSRNSQAGRLDRMSGGQRHAKTKPSSRGPSGWSPLGSDGSRDGQARCWTVITVAKDAQGRVGKQP